MSYTLSVLDLQRKPFIAALVYGLSFAVIFGLAFPPFGFWPLALVALVPLVIVGLKTPKPLRSAIAAAMGTLPLWAFHHQYIWAMSEAGVFPLVLYLAIYPALFIWLLARLTKRLPGMPLFMLVPILWVGLEYLRGDIVWHGYPWYMLAHPLIDLPPLAFYASIVGVYGVSALVAMTVGWIFDLRRWNKLHDSNPHAARHFGNNLRYIGVAIGLLFLLGIPFAHEVRRPDARIMRLVAVQTNIPQDNRFSWSFDQRLADMKRLAELTQTAASVSLVTETPNSPPVPGADLIIWPETMFPGNALNNEAVQAERDAGLQYPGGVSTTVFHQTLIELQNEVGSPILIGARAVDNLRFEIDDEGRIRENSDSRSYNSAFIVAAGVVSSLRYDKMHLTPFGEVMPYISAWPWLESRLLALGARGMAFDLDAGTTPTVLQVPGLRERPPLRIAAPICFEATIPTVCRDLVIENKARKADLLVNISNDGWFAWFDGGRENLLLQCRWRCIELGTPMVRAANTGISALIDSRGRLVLKGPNVPIIHPSPARVEGLVVGELQLPDDRLTIYAQFGDVLGVGSLVAAVVLTVFSFFVPIPLPPGTLRIQAETTS